MQQAEQRPLRIFCKDDQGLNMAVRGDDVILVHADPNDKSQGMDFNFRMDNVLVSPFVRQCCTRMQHWFQDYGAVGKLTDDQGRRAFALVNRTTGQAMVNRDDVVRLAPYSPDVGVEVSMLWSLGMKLSGGFAEVRTLKDLSKTINGLNGRVKEGTRIGMYYSEPSSPHAIWKLDPITDQ